MVPRRVGGAAANVAAPVELDLQLSHCGPSLVQLENGSPGTHLAGAVFGVCSGEALDDGPESGGVGLNEGGVGDGVRVEPVLEGGVE